VSLVEEINYNQKLMKLFVRFGLMVAIAFATISQLYSQSYQALNKVVLIVREVKTTKPKIYVSKGLSVKTDLERNEFTFQVSTTSFLQTDTTKKIKIDSLLPESSFPMLSFKGSLPFNKLDKDISNKQTVTVQGTFYIGSQSYTTYLPVEFEFMDKQLLFDTYFMLNLTNFNIELPKELLDKYSTSLEFRIDNGHLLTRP
jgi:hypothetical protein